MHARLFPRIKKTKKAISCALKATFFTLFIVLNIFALVTPAFAQQTGLQTQIKDIPGSAGAKLRATEARYEGLNTLFDPKDKPATLDISAAWATARRATDLTFIFNGAFAINKPLNGDWDNANDFWNEIKDGFNSDTPIFVLRVCSVDQESLPIETSCEFYDFPKGVDTDDVAERLVGTSPVIENNVTVNLTKFISHAETFTIESTDTTLGKRFIDYLHKGAIYHYRMQIDNTLPGKEVVNANTFRDKPGSTSYEYTEERNYLFSVQHTPTNELSFSGSTSGKVLEKGKTYQADLWYCAARDNSEDLTTTNETTLENLKADAANIRVFGELCDKNHLAYIRMAGVQFKMPSSAEEIAQLNNQNQEAATTELASSSSVLPNCHILNGWGPGTGSFVGCLAYIFYYAIYWPISWLAGIMGNLFDFFLGYSISDDAYRLAFVSDGWKLVRDISNIFFIIILVWTGLAAVLT